MPHFHFKSMPEMIAKQWLGIIRLLFYSHLLRRWLSSADVDTSMSVFISLAFRVSVRVIAKDFFPCHFSFRVCKSKFLNAGDFDYHHTCASIDVGDERFWVCLVAIQIDWEVTNNGFCKPANYLHRGCFSLRCCYLLKLHSMASPIMSAR